MSVKSLRFRDLGCVWLLFIGFQTNVTYTYLQISEVKCEVALEFPDSSGLNFVQPDKNDGKLCTHYKAGLDTCSNRVAYSLITTGRIVPCA